MLNFCWKGRCVLCLSECASSSSINTFYCEVLWHKSHPLKQCLFCFVLEHWNNIKACSLHAEYQTFDLGLDEINQLHNLQTCVKDFFVHLGGVQKSYIHIDILSPNRVLTQAIIYKHQHKRSSLTLICCCVSGNMTNASPVFTLSFFFFRSLFGSITRKSY